MIGRRGSDSFFTFRVSSKAKKNPSKRLGKSIQENGGCIISDNSQMPSHERRGSTEVRIIVGTRLETEGGSFFRNSNPILRYSCDGSTDVVDDSLFVESIY